MAARIEKVELKKDGTIKVKYKQNEVPRSGDMEFCKAKYLKESEQLAHKDLTNAFARLTPHLLFSTELIGEDIAIPSHIEDKEYFDKFHFEDDPRFADVHVTAVQTYGKDSLDGVQLFGYKENSKGYQCKFKTDVIYLDRADPNHYQLLVILDSQIETLLHEVEEYINGKTVAKAQMELELPKAS